MQINGIGYQNQRFYKENQGFGYQHPHPPGQGEQIENCHLIIQPNPGFGVPKSDFVIDFLGLGSQPRILAPTYIFSLREWVSFPVMSKERINVSLPYGTTWKFFYYGLAAHRM